MLGAAENGRYEVFEDVFVFAIRIGIDERKWKCLMNKKVINFLEERYRNRLGIMGFFNLLYIITCLTLIPWTCRKLSAHYAGN